MKFTAFLHRVIIGKNDRIEQVQPAQPVPVTKTPSTPSQPKKPKIDETQAALQRQQVPLQDHDAVEQLPAENIPQMNADPFLAENKTDTDLSKLDQLVSQLNPSQKLLLENYAQQLIDQAQADANTETDTIPAAYPDSEQAQLPSSSQAGNVQQSSAASEEDQMKALQTSEFISSLAQATEEQTYSRANVDFYKKQAAQEEIRIPNRDARLDQLRQLVVSSVTNPQDLGRLIASNSF